MTFHQYVTHVLLLTSFVKVSVCLSNTMLIDKGDFTRLSCASESSNNGSPVWKFNNKTLISSNDRQPGTENIIIKNVNSSITELLIDHFTKSNEGQYHCLVNKIVINEYILEIDECQSIFSLNGKRIEEFSFITAGISYNILCKQKKGCKKREIVEVSTTTVFEHENGLNDEANRTFRTHTGSVTYAMVFPDNAIDIFMSCERNSSNGNDDVVVARKKLHVYVIPDLKIQINNVNISGELNAYEGDVVILRCVAFGSRPEVKLLWKSGSIDKYIDTGTLTSRNIHNPILHDYESHLNVTVKGSIHISCSSNLSSTSILQHATLDIEIYDGVILLMFVGLSVLFLCVIFLSSAFIYKRRKQDISEGAFYQCNNLPISSGTSLEVLNSKEYSTYEDAEVTTHSPVVVSIKQSDKDEKTNFRLMLVLISLFPAGSIFSYWKASPKDRPDNEYIVAKTVSENAKMKDGYNFLKIAASLRELDNHPNIVKYIGCSVDEVPYFIYQEYMENGNLRDLLLSYLPQRESTSCEYGNCNGLQHPMVFAKAIGDAMVFLNSNELCHPGLAARKVLLGNKLTPKLFDFWPIDLSADRITNLKESKNPPIAWLPPETVFLSEYTMSSDIWSFGIFLWEIFSFGETPYQQKDIKEIEEHIREMKCLEQPTCCPGAIFNIMLSTWHKNSRQRPTMLEVRFKIDELYEDIVKVDMNKPADTSYIVLEPNDYKEVNF